MGNCFVVMSSPWRWMGMIYDIDLLGGYDTTTASARVECMLDWHIYID